MALLNGIQKDLNGRYIFIALVHLSEPHTHSLLAILFIFSLFNTAGNLDFFLRVLAPSFHRKYQPIYQKILSYQHLAVTWVAVNEVLLLLHSIITLFGPERSIIRLFVCLQFIAFRYNTSIETKTVFMVFDSLFLKIFTHPYCPKPIFNIYNQIKGFFGNYLNVIAGNQ